MRPRRIPKYRINLMHELKSLFGALFIYYCLVYLFSKEFDIWFPVVLWLVLSVFTHISAYASWKKTFNRRYDHIEKMTSESE